MRITVDVLVKARACEDDIEKFRARWPNGCEVTKDNCIEAFCDLDLSPNWAALKLLPTLAAVNMYARVRDMALAEFAEAYKKDGATAIAEYKVAHALAFWQAAAGGKTQ